MFYNKQMPTELPSDGEEQEPISPLDIPLREIISGPEIVDAMLEFWDDRGTKVTPEMMRRITSLADRLTFDRDEQITLDELTDQMDPLDGPPSEDV